MSLTEQEPIEETGAYSFIEKATHLNFEIRCYIHFFSFPGHFRESLRTSGAHRFSVVPTETRVPDVVTPFPEGTEEKEGT